MHLLCNFVNVYMKSCICLLNVFTNMTANNKKLMVFTYDNTIIVNSDQQPPIMSVRLTSIKLFIQLSLNFSQKDHVVPLISLVYPLFLALNFVLLPISCTLTCNFVNVFHYVHACIPSSSSCEILFPT